MRSGPGWLVPWKRSHFAVIVLLAVVVPDPGCVETGSTHAVLIADLPLHLEDHLEVATIEGSQIPDNLPAPVEWRFDRPQPDWKPVQPIPEGWDPVKPVRVADALRLPLTARNRLNGPRLIGQIYVELPDWSLEEWGYVEIRARTRDPMRYVGLDFNHSQKDPGGDGRLPFYSPGDRALLVTDGTVQTYRLSLDSPFMRRWDGPWTHLAIWFNSRDDEEAVALDILSVRVIPREANFAGKRAGVTLEQRGIPGVAAQDSPLRRSLYMHAPGRIAYQVRVPEQGRLDVGLGVLREDLPVTFAISARRRSGELETLLDEVYSDHRHWAQRSVDLSHLAGQTLTLTLEARSQKAGAVALWAVPTVSGARSTAKPNIIFYVIDGAGADYMSVYGYNRRTTPNLERIAAEGAIFERAYSNSSWTRTSTPSFLTSLQHSVLGGLRNGRNPVPDEVLTSAEHLHRAGYQTAEFTSNANAGRISNLERGVDVFRDAGVPNWSASSVPLQGSFWRWREEYPAEPYWVHFQTTDVHNDHVPVAPFGGLFVSPERRRNADEWIERTEQIPETPDLRIIEAIDRIGVGQVEYWTAGRDLHDETMAHQDYQLGQLVARLKAAGEWERTLLIVAADHSVAAGSWDYRLLMRDPQPPHVYHDDPGTPMLRPGVSGIPMIFVWPGRIAPGRRFSQPVSMIDMLPTILDLADLPMPEVMQGQSLAPLLLGREGWLPRPVILDEFEVDGETGESRGRIEVVDGRWGASLEINSSPPEDDEETSAEGRRTAPLLLYDLWNDPDCLRSVHDERPRLVDKYTTFLEAQWKAHQALARRFSRSGDSPLTPEQLRALRSLGYIQ